MELKLMHIACRTNKDGSERYYFRRRGQPVQRLPNDPASAEFMTEYHKCLNWVAPEKENTKGTFAWLCDEYINSPEFQANKESTIKDRKRVIMTMLAEPLEKGKPETFGMESAKRIGKAHAEVLRDRKADNPNAANKRLKVLSRIFSYALDKGIIETNFVRDVKRFTIKSTGHETATDEHIERYLAHHPSGMANLAMVILKETGVRVSDLRVLSWTNVKNGYLIFTTVKTGQECQLPIEPELAAVLPKSRMTFIEREIGGPFESDKALSQRISKWFRQAGVEGVTAHGVRKWLATKMAEEGVREYSLAAWFGWSDPKEARPYVKAADKRKMNTDTAEKMRNRRREQVVNLRST